MKMPISRMARIAGTCSASIFASPAFAQGPNANSLSFAQVMGHGLFEAHTETVALIVLLIVGLVILSIIFAISHHRRLISEKQLARTAQNYSNMFLHSSEGIVLVNSDGIILDANPRALSIMGASIEQIQGTESATLLHPDDTPPTEADVRKVRNGMTARLQRRIRSRTGTYIPIDMSIKQIGEGMTQILFRDLSETIRAQEELTKANAELSAMYEQMAAANEQLSAGNIELQHEMQAREKVENELRAREALLQTVFRATPIGIGIVDRDRKVGWTNHAAQAMLGYTAEELDGMSARHLYESEEEYLRVGREKHSEVLEKGYGSVETRMKAKDGHALDVILSSGSIENGTLEAGLVFTIQDLTEFKRTKRESKQLRELLFNESHVPQLILDPNTGDIVEANKAAAAYFCRTEAALQNASLDTVFTDSRHDAFRSIREAAALGFPSRMEVRQGRSKRGFADIHANRLHHEGKAIFYAIVHDVSEHLRSEAALLEAKNLAESASRMKNEFLANMSHEVRTPLNGILGMLQLLEDTDLSVDQSEFTEAALHSGRGLQTILNDILDFSMIEAGKLAISENRFSPTKVVDNIALVFRRQCMDKGISLTTEIDPSLPEQVRGDEGRLRQILFNLVGNAVKFTHKGTVEVALTTVRHEDKNTERLLITVTDTGIGIPEDRLKDVFAPFTQADGSMTRKYDGAGLGLAIVKRLVGLMHGMMSISSERGEGTEVAVLLPMRKSGMQKQAEDPLPEPVHSTERNKVLVAEDNPVNRIATKRFLEKLGFDPVCVPTGEDALEALAANEFACILMDIQMPGMSGLEATQTIRNDTTGKYDSAIPIIALTAHAMKGDKEKFLGAGMNAYLAKPVEFTELASMLSRFR